MSRFLSRLFLSNPLSKLTSTDKRSPKRTKCVHLQLEELERRLVPASPYEVTVAADDPNNPIPQQTTLRDAIGAALKGGGGVGVTFAPNVGGQTIQLQAPLPAIDNSINIVNNTGQEIAVAGSGSTAQNKYNVFIVLAGVNCQIYNLTISNGYTTGGGGGIINYGTLTLDNDRIVDNTAQGSGGGIYNVGTLTLQSTAVNNNGAGQNGAGIYNSNSGRLTIRGNSSIVNNRADGNGGGVYNGGTMTMITTVVEYNSTSVASKGGGIYGSGIKTSLSQVAIDNNFSGTGGGIYMYYGGLTIKASEINSNTADGTGGGGIYMRGGTAVISGGSINFNKAPNGNECGGGIYNLSSTLTLTGNLTIRGNSAAKQGGGVYLGILSITNFQGVTVGGGDTATTGAGVAYEAGATLNNKAGLTDKDDPNGPVQV